MGRGPRKRLQHRRRLRPAPPRKERRAVGPRDHPRHPRGGIPGRGMKRSLKSVFPRPPLRVRITAAASASIAVILVTLSLLVYIRLHAELLRAIDSGLQARASAIAGSVGQLRQARHAISDGPDVSYTAPVQILTPGGRVVAQSGTELPPLPARYLRHLSH